MAVSFLKIKIAGIHEIIFAGPRETLRFKREAGDFLRANPREFTRWRMCMA